MEIANKSQNKTKNAKLLAMSMWIRVKECAFFVDEKHKVKD